jgi:hypothetical protein
MKKTLKTRILCKTENQYHTLVFSFDPDGAATAVSSGCDDITAAAKRVAGAISLGKTLMEDNCTGLAALLVHGIPVVFRQPPMGEYIQWGAWKPLYTRFESNKLVAAAVKREQAALRKREREQKTQAQA